MTAAVVVLLSGGMDSATVCLRYAERNHEVVPLFVDYGQAAAASEMQSAEDVARHLGIVAPHRAVVKLPRRRTANSLLRPPDRQPSIYLESVWLEYVAHRNLLLGGVAAPFAADVGAKTIAFGIIDGTRSNYPDCRPSFLDALENAARICGDIAVEAPFIDNTKAQVVEYGQASGLDYALTYSCNRRAGQPCGACASCQERDHALGATTKENQYK